jgi:hypothetical protein
MPTIDLTDAEHAAAALRLRATISQPSRLPQTEVASSHSINDDEQRDEPERPGNILDHCLHPERVAAGSVVQTPKRALR